eukprot:15441472-Alexandrium_andersonii.AAC.1
MAICYCHHHPIFLTIMMVVVRGPKWVQTRSPEVLRGSFCAVFRAERECGNDNLAGALQGSFLCGRSRWARRWF